MYLQKTLIKILKQNSRPKFLLLHSSTCINGANFLPGSQHRFISSTTSVNSWMDAIKGVFTGKKEGSKEIVEDFTLTHFADALEKARKIGNFKQFIVGRSSEATFSDAFGRMGEILRYLGTIDPSGENIQAFHKQEAAKHCKCTVAEVESALSKFTWAKLAQAKIMKLKEEGKPMPKSINEVQKLVGSTPLDIARSNLAESGQISRNAPCPCGSKKRYKWCCGKDK